MGFLLFLVVNAIMVLRPAEIIPDLLELPIYNTVMVACLAVSAPAILRELRPGTVMGTPITFCVLGLQGAVVLSHLSNGDTTYARMMGFEFSKTVAYYLLLVGLLDSSIRFRKFTVAMTAMIAVMTSLALLHHHGLVDLPTLETLTREELDPATGELYSVLQLQGTGIFNDPNDLCLILIVGMAICLGQASDRRSGPLRSLWLGPLALFGYALAQTNSRGGFLGLLAGMTAMIVARFGARRSIPLAMLTLPAMFILFAGRQTNISTSSGTGQARIQLWLAGLEAFRGAPLFGIGQGLCADAIGQETHNSFIHCYPDIGFLGGTLFLAMYAAAFEALFKVGPMGTESADPELLRLRPYLIGMLVGYAVGMCSISRAYILPTYMLPGLVVAYTRLVISDPSATRRRVDGRFARDAALISLGFLILAHVYVRTFVRFG